MLNISIPDSDVNEIIRAYVAGAALSSVCAKNQGARSVIKAVLEASNVEIRPPFAPGRQPFVMTDNQYDVARGILDKGGTWATVAAHTGLKRNVVEKAFLRKEVQLLRN